jgi:hypothetical protein
MSEHRDPLWAGSHIDSNQCFAVEAQLSDYLVALSLTEGKGVGSGTLIYWEERHFILTASHCISGESLEKLRVYSQPSGPLVEISPEELMRRPNWRATRGEKLDIKDVVAISDEYHDDIAILELKSLVGISQGARFYHLIKEQVAPADGEIIFSIGYATEGSIKMAPCVKGIVATRNRAAFDSTQNARNDLHSIYKSDRHFLIPYTRTTDKIPPHGFSGTGAWYNAAPIGPIWAANPKLVGVVTRWHKGKNILQITGISCILDLFATIQ